LQPSKYTAFVSATNGYYVRPLGYGIRAFDIGGHGRSLPVTIAGMPPGSRLEAHGVLGDDKTVYVTLINMDRGSSASPVNVVFHLDDPAYGGAEIMRLTAPDANVMATSGETLGDSTISNEGRWKGSWQSLVKPAGDSPLTVELPPTSAVIVKLKSQ
jgi:hypothetical protein